MRNHHGKPSEHAANDPLRIYMPPLSEWRRDTENGARLWTHPEIGWTFVVGSRGKMGYVRTSYSRDGKITFRATDGDVYKQIKRWYAHQTPSSMSRLSERNPDRPPSVAGKLRQFAILDRDRYVGVVDTGNRYDDTSEEGALAQYIADERARGTSPHFYKDRYAVAVRRSERNPDWSAMREKASHYAGRAAAGARSAYDWTAPRARAAYDWTAPRARAAGHAAWEGTKAAGRAVKRGAKRAAPVIARGAKSAAERMERWAAEPNGAKYSVYVQGSGWSDTWAVSGGLRAAVASARDAVSGRNEVVSASVYKTADRSARDVVTFTNRNSDGNVGRVRKIAG